MPLDPTEMDSEAAHRFLRAARAAGWPGGRIDEGLAWAKNEAPGLRSFEARVRSLTAYAADRGWPASSVDQARTWFDFVRAEWDEVS